MKEIKVTSGQREWGKKCEEVLVKLERANAYDA